MGKWAWYEGYGLCSTKPVGWAAERKSREGSARWRTGSRAGSKGEMYCCELMLGGGVGYSAIAADWASCGIYVSCARAEAGLKSRRGLWIPALALALWTEACEDEGDTKMDELVRGVWGETCSSGTAIGPSSSSSSPSSPSCGSGNGGPICRWLIGTSGTAESCVNPSWVYAKSCCMMGGAEKAEWLELDERQRSWCWVM